MGGYLSRHNKMPDYSGDAPTREKAKPVKQKQRDSQWLLSGSIRTLTPDERVAAAEKLEGQPDRDMLLDMLGMTDQMLADDREEIQFRSEEKSA